MEHEELTREDLRELADLKDAEAGTYLALLAPILHRLGGGTVITEDEVLGVPEDTVVCMEVAEAGIRVWLGPAPTEE